VEVQVHGSLAGRVAASDEVTSIDIETPESVPETVELLAEYRDDAKILAGGRALGPMLASRLAGRRC